MMNIFNEPQTTEENKNESSTEFSDQIEIFGKRGPEPQATKNKLLSIRQIAKMRNPYYWDQRTLEINRIIQSNMSDRKVLNAFRGIRTNILQKSRANNAVILVTATSQEAGTTFVALNLAVAFAFDEGRSALLVDCNFNQSILDKLSKKKAASPGQTNPYGLTDYLENPKVQIEDIIRASGLARLRIISAGDAKESSYEYFVSPKLEALFAELKQRYPERFVIVDAPPLSDSVDTRILIELCDYVVLVAPYGKSSESQILETAKKIDKNKLLGVVFNNSPALPFSK